MTNRTSRKILAATVLAASLSLPVATEGLRASEALGIDAQWALVLGMKGREAAAFGAASVLLCGAIANPGSIACGLAGVG